VSSSSKASSSFFQSTNYAFDASDNDQTSVSSSFALQDTLSLLSKIIISGFICVLTTRSFQNPVDSYVPPQNVCINRSAKRSHFFKHVLSSIRLASKSFIVSPRTVSYRFSSKCFLRSYRFRSPYFKNMPLFISFRFNIVSALFQLRFISFRFASRCFSPRLTHFNISKTLRDTLRILKSRLAPQSHSTRCLSLLFRFLLGF